MSAPERKPARRAKGEGTVEEIGSGLYRARIVVDGRKVTGRASPTKKGARASLREAVARAEEERRAAEEPRSPSFTSSLGAYIRARTGRLSPTTLENYRLVARLLEVDPLGSVPAREVTEADLRAWIARQTVSPGTVRRRLSLLKGALRSEGNPVSVAAPPSRRHRRRPLRPEEREVLRARLAEAPEYVRAAVMLGLYTGLRRSEIAGLRHEDLAHGGVYVRRNVVWTSEAIVVKSVLKTAESEAWVPLPPQVAGLVREGAQGFVVAGPRGPGEPVNPKTLGWWMRRIVRGTALADVPFMGWHALRRTYGMDLLEAGVDVVTAAAAMRHDPAVLVREYARSREDLKRAGVERAFGRAVDGAPEEGAAP